MSEDQEASLRAEIAKLQKRCDAMNVLARYADHVNLCARINGGVQCTCGFDDALAAVPWMMEQES